MLANYSFTREDLVAAFTRWHADCEKNADGTLAGAVPDDPALMADTLIGYLPALEAV